MVDGHYNVLFLSNRNAARSVLAESVMNRVGRPNFAGFSAGIRPEESLDPLVADILEVARYPTDDLHPKSSQEFARSDAPPLDFVFTLCDPAAGEELPRWPRRPVTANWRYPDPAKLCGETWERRQELGAMLARLERQLQTFVQLPLKSLDEISLRERLHELGQGVAVD